MEYRSRTSTVIAMKLKKKMNSRNLSRFHKFSDINFEKKITEINLAPSFLHSSQIQIQKRIQEKERKLKKIKFYYKIYTEFLFVPLFLGSEDGRLLYYSNIVYLYCQKKLGRIPKKRLVGFPKEFPVYCPRSRPCVDVTTWISLVCSCSVATLLLLL